MKNDIGTIEFSWLYLSGCYLIDIFNPIVSVIPFSHNTQGESVFPAGEDLIIDLIGPDRILVVLKNCLRFIIDRSDGCDGGIVLFKFHLLFFG